MITTPLSTGETPTTEPFAAVCAWQNAYLSPRDIDAFNCELYARFSNGPLFVAAAECRLNIDRLLEAHGNQLRRAAQLDVRKKGGPWRTDHRQLLFEIEREVFVFVNSNIACLRVFARDRVTAESTMRRLADRFRIKSRRKVPAPRFHLLGVIGNIIDAIPVEVRERVRRTDDQLALLYGDEFLRWGKSLIDTLRTKSTGTVILRGQPGVGKTSFIRHLFSRLNATHRFYFLPTTNFELLTTPSLVEFWQSEATRYPNQQKVIVLEDAEALLADRGAGNRGQIANLLNIADGLLGDFLHMQIICSVNCGLQQLDPALVRSGRLLALWEFKRRSPQEAERIAIAHNLTLLPQEDYSLAEIFNGAAKTTAAPTRRPIGFGANLAAAASGMG